MASTPDTPLDDHAAATLTAMARVLYPHDFLDDAPYRRVVAILAGEGDAGRQALLAEGVAALAEKERLVAVLAVEGTPFFEAVRAATARHLYDNRELWPRFGYEGPSADLGGYIERGFDDLDWIADADIEPEAGP